MREAEIEETPTGRRPAGEGWFILNLAEIGWEGVPGNGTWCLFESPSAPSKTLGIGVHVLEPGEPPCLYHAESEQEGFLVLSGECLAIVEGEERLMRTWDYLHCPPGTAHLTIGAGDGPCAILMVGTRSPDETVHYPADPVAARHGGAVAVPTDSPREAYADRPPIVPAPSPWPLGAAGRRLEIARECYRAYETGERERIERHLSDDFTFFSPADPGIDRARYFERCWPNAETVAAFEFLRLAEAGDGDVIVTYVATRADGSHFQNTEVLSFAGDKVRRSEVYFGWDLAD